MTAPNTPSSRRGARTRRGEETRALLLNAALEQFLRGGFHGTSMRQIADGAGVAVGGIYNHFANKEALFAAVLDANHPYHVIMPALEHAQGDTLEDFVRDAARLYQSNIHGLEDRLLPLVLIDIVEFQGRHLRTLAETILPSVLVFIQGFGDRPGQLRNLPLPLVMRAFISLIIGYMVTQSVLKDSPLLQPPDYDWFGGMVEVYLHGISAAAPPEAANP